MVGGLWGLLGGLGLLTQTERPDEKQLAKDVQGALEEPELLDQTKRARGRERAKKRRSLGSDSAVPIDAGKEATGAGRDRAQETTRT